jgi:hypothetical protein
MLLLNYLLLSADIQSPALSLATSSNGHLQIQSNLDLHLQNQSCSQKMFLLFPLDQGILLEKGPQEMV